LAKEVTNSEETWVEVFTRMAIVFEVQELCELEFRKAYYKHKFDRNWLNEL